MELLETKRLSIINLLGQSITKDLIKTSFLVLISTVFIGIAVSFLSAQMPTGGYLFAVVPSAVLVANFSETTKPRWLSELVIEALLLAGVFQFGCNISLLLN